MNEKPALKPYFITCAAIFAPLALALVVLSHWPGYGLADLLQGQTPPAESAPEEPGTKAGFDCSAVVEQVLPSVVTVHTSKENMYKTVFVDHTGKGREQAGVDYDKPTLGVGSGLIVSAEGHILTCWHVLKHLDLENQRDVCSVQLSSEHELRRARLIGMDRNADLAVLKLIDPVGRELPVLPWGDSEAMRRGNFVIAVGSPFGLLETITHGILSNCDRRIGDSDYYLPHFQTDCVINHGNSGGPLINARGEVIGICDALYAGPSEEHSWQGIGLALRSNEAQAALEAILQSRAARGYLGAYVEEEKFNPRTDTHRIYLAGVDERSPAAHAGLLADDTLVAIEGAPVQSVEDWKRTRKLAGETVSISILRGAEQTPLTIKVTLIDISKGSQEPPEIVDLGPPLDLKVKAADPVEAWRYKLGGWAQGSQFILVMEVAPGSILAGKVQAGDILKNVDGSYRVNKTPTEVQSALTARLPQEPLRLAIWRNGQSPFIIYLP